MSQKHDHTWMLGYNGSGYHEDFGLIKIPFTAGEMKPFEYINDSLDFFTFRFNFTGTIMSDSAGELVFYYNGFQIRDRFNQVPPGGDTLNTFWFWQNFNGGPGINAGLPIRQSSLALPIPGYDNEYLLLSATASLHFINIGRVIADRIYMHRVRDNGDEGLEVLISNEYFLDGDTLNPGRLTTVRHANGRDWWLLFGKFNASLEYIAGYYRYLLTPSGLIPAGYQAFDFPVYGHDAGQYCYNLTGDKLIMVNNHLIGEPGNLVIFDFDRCTGVLSNMKHHLMEQELSNFNGCAISPNNRYLYASGLLNIYQYDLEAEDIFASEQIVGVIDTTVFTPNFITIAGNAQLAPDGKIYFANGSGTTALNVIHFPDSAGMACGFEQNGFPLPVYNFRTIPNFPNYCLGALEGSPCDTLDRPYDYCILDSVVSVQDIVEAESGKLSIHPNPSSSTATVQIPGPGRLALYDLQGRLLKQESIQAYQLENPTAHEMQINTNTLPAGMYMLVFYADDGFVYRGKLGVF